MSDKDDQYFDAYDAVTHRWLGCVKADNEEHAKQRASEKSGVALVFIYVTPRSE